MPSPSIKSGGQVYVFWGARTPYFKIGFTQYAVADRYRAVQRGVPFQLRIIGSRPGTLSLERELHRRFAGYRVRGEWFALPETVALELLGWVDAGVQREPWSDDYRRWMLERSQECAGHA